MKIWTTIGLAALAVFSCAGDTIYAAGSSVKDQKITLKSWGSGSIAETDEVAYEGTTSVRISTRNIFQGGKMIFQTAADLAKATEDKNNLIRFAIKIAGDDVIAVSAPVKGAGAAGPKAGGKAGGKPGFGAGDDSGGGKSGASESSVSVDKQPMKTLRMVFTTTDGMKSEIFLGLEGRSGKNGWREIAVPLQAIPGFMKSNKVLKDVTFTGDSTATFYVGEIKIVNDTTAVTADLNMGDMNIGIGTEIEFHGSGYAGSSPLTYTWDFDAADGVQVDAEGGYVKHRFRKSGSFTVTLTVSDSYGLKAPVSKTMKVTVN